MFESKVDMRSRKEMTTFLTNHYRYWTMNSWNRSSAYANNVKLYNLNLPEEIEDKAYDFVCGDVESDYEWDVRFLIEEFERETGYGVGFNGRSSGYLVMYEMSRKEDEHKSYCPFCGQQNFQLATPENNKCGKCGKEGRLNFDKPRYIYHTYPGKSVGSDDEEYYEDFTMRHLREEVKLVQRFDQLCDDIRGALIQRLQDGEIVEEEYTEVKTRKVLKEM